MAILRPTLMAGLAVSSSALQSFTPVRNVDAARSSPVKILYGERPAGTNLVMPSAGLFPSPDG